MERLSDPISSIGEYRALGGMRGLERALSMTPEAVIDEVEASGLRGRGGAGFLVLDDTACIDRKSVV